MVHSPRSRSQVQNNAVVPVPRRHGRKPPGRVQTSDGPAAWCWRTGSESLRAASTISKDRHLSTVLLRGVSAVVVLQNSLPAELDPPPRQNPLLHPAKTRLCDGNGKVLFFSNNNNNNDDRLKKLLHIDSTLKPCRPHHSSISSVDFLRLCASESCHL